MFISDNELVRQPGGLARIWLTGDATDYWPLSYTLFWLAWRAFGPVTWPYHLIALGLHVANALLAWRLLARVAVPGAFLASCLFALHPVNVETAAWIFQIKTSLSTLFALMTTTWWVRSRATFDRAHLASIGAFGAGLLAKTSIVAWPLLLGVLDWWRRGRLGRRDLARLAPHLGLSLAFGTLSLLWYKYDLLSGGERVRTDQGVETALIAARAVWFYLGRALWPFDLSFIYPRWVIDAGDPRAWLAPAGLIVATGAAVVAAARGHRTPLALAAAFVLALAPALGMVDVYFFRFSFVADHYQYPAILVPLALVAAMIARAPERLVVAGIVLAACATLTFRRAGVFVDEPTVWADTLARNTHAWLALYNSGNIAYGNGDPTRALGFYERALSEKPDYVDAMVGAGAAELALGREAAGRARFERALEIFPGHARALNNLATLALNHGDPATAARYLNEATARLPDYFLGHRNLGLVYLRLGDATRARAAFGKALELKPDDAEVRANLDGLNGFR